MRPPRLPQTEWSCGSNKKTSRSRTGSGYFLEQHNPFHSCSLEQNATRSIATLPKWDLSQIIPKEFVRLYQNCARLSIYLIRCLARHPRTCQVNILIMTSELNSDVRCRLEHMCKVGVLLFPPSVMLVCQWKQLARLWQKYTRSHFEGCLKVDGTSFPDAGSLVMTAHVMREICPRDLKCRKSKTDVAAQKLLHTRWFFSCLSEIRSKRKLSFGRQLLSNSVCVRKTLFVTQCPKFKAKVFISVAINPVGDRDQ